ncbi:hypothetical protein IYW40_15485 [Methylocystis sp. H4A]|uniref:hypothetical protein n=1 Tax=Methylocystis sp. H4A TaxID=2785788 RepID=UPI0018C300E2|nr:hypothetical protein [Methylocystis sp. H4A]MBG0802869.1 hypothetical protein [Methylocystis sp. H4A]
MSHKELLKQGLRRQLADGKTLADIIVELSLGLLVDVDAGELSTSEALAIFNLYHKALRDIAKDEGRAL